MKPLKKFSAPGNNEPCWCGSNKKYKHCHQAFDRKMETLKRENKKVPPRSLIKNEDDIHWIKEAAKINNGVLDLVGEKIHAGMTTNEIDKLVYDYTVEHGGIPAPLGYNGFPKSCCTSINDAICHGIPDDTKLKDGDVVNVDCTTIVNGHYADASRMFCIGEVSKEAKRLVDVTKECLEAGVAAVKPWGHVGDIGAAIQEIAHRNGYSVVLDFCGHGVGNAFHEDPMVAHVGRKDCGMILAPGMVFTIEPMINQGVYSLFIDADNNWTAYTDDGKLSAQWEKTLLVTDDGIEVLAW
ncbi:methionyl aminopeptidase [Ileibacterium valens]|uniref:methionyl aminopeptidase n=1 Tax=Ileibacterium valens TaxID=1862668 RepID=UPI0024B9152E|nr:methionyl aminopeptidase [Ileibacterium valens]